ncbi:EAL domain-containing response regulator [Halarcobacter anaerophilus]|uniref:Diguanylate cyclase n=1 Tax=Halarcobacter anaerophilus TaxID=877500 RepID=A0A4Q0XV56_9BACT|nr:EAL domain-containing protein [Halarcobacter anaerophilus]QDF28024.1 PAS sensor-containing diguanylate phosphodiesterase [Halarcobacter anaerophilus]RXJ61460.1 diguanylate cyclase [Halarcobacter anaerophilus]
MSNKDFSNNLIKNAKDLRALYVEDNKDVANAVYKILNLFLDKIDLAFDGEEGLAKVESCKYDLVLTDINMPKMNGIELIESIRKIAPHIPIIVISAYGEQEYLFKAIQAGIDGFILKPLEPEQFKRVLFKAIEKTLIYKENNKNLSILKQYQDITNRSSIISKTDPTGIITFVNENFVKISEYSKEELIGRSHALIRHPDNSKEFFRDLWHTISIEKKPWEGVIKNLSKSGKPYYVKTVIKPLLDEEGNVLEYIALRNDISEIMSEKKQMLSSLESNRNSLLIMIQIENFDILDKFYDNKTVEKIEQIYGKTILDHMPNKELFEKIYSLGDGCFVITEDFDKLIANYPEINIEEQLHEFIKNTKNSTIKLENIEYDISVIVSYSYGTKNLYENVKYGVEKAIEKKKNLIFANNLVSEAQENAKKNIETIQMVKKALDESKIISFFQPIIDNKTKKIIKYESLVRLINEKDEIVSPYFFLETSKQGSYYTKITNRVIENSFEILDHIKDNISINISAIDIENDIIRNRLIVLVSKPEYKGRVTFELLEDENIKDFKKVKDFIKLVKDIGNVQIAIDDFGSGYSNFERLLEYSPDILKIDGSLIKNIEHDDFSRNLVETLVVFAKKQGIKTIAEFVENENIYNILTELGVDYSQGFYFGKPEKLI